MTGFESGLSLESPPLGGPLGVEQEQEAGFYDPTNNPQPMFDLAAQDRRIEDARAGVDAFFNTQ